MKKLLSIILISTLALSAMAKTYYCDPASTRTTGTASSWESAVSPAALRQNINGLKDNDTVYIKGGTILITQLSEVFQISKSITFIGGFDPAATGKVTSLPYYPSATPTIFSGDVNRNGKPDPGDAQSLIRVDYSGNASKVFTMIGCDLINTYYDGEVDSPNDVLTSTAMCAALRVLCGTAYIRNCHFYNHVTPNGRGSQCVTAVGAKLHMSDCELHDGISLTRGGLLRSRQYFPDGDTAKAVNPDCVLERCCLYNGNNMAGDTMNTAGFYGGAVQISNGPFFAINCTFAYNRGYSDGGCVNCNQSGGTFISCTVVNNKSMRAYNMDDVASSRNSYGSSLHISKNGVMRLANNIVLGPDDNGSKQYAVAYSCDNTLEMKENVVSGGCNITGTYFYYKNNSQVNDQSAVWMASDKWTMIGGSTIQKMADYLGTNPQMTDNGGCSKTIMPLQMQNGDNVAHLQALADAWCPSWTKVDASVDQRGVKRNANVTCVGAAAYEGTAGPLYTISTSVNNTAYGSVTGAGTYEQGRVVYLTATPKNGYFFSHWSDGNTDNPRAVTVTKDAAFVAYFTNSYMNATILSDNSNLGYVIGGGQVAPHAQVSIGALCTKEGYRFSHWSDGSTIPGRTIEVTRDTTLIAYFIEDRAAKCYDVSSNDPTKGKVDIQIIATPAEGNSFMCWLDGNTDNPRVVTNAPGSYMAVFMGSSSLTPVRVVDEDGTIKIIRDGQLYILRDGKTYNAQGTEVR